MGQQNHVHIIRRYWETIEARDWKRAWFALHPRFRATWPVTKESFDRATFMRINEEYPAPNWHIKIERVNVVDDGVVSVVCVTDGPQWFYCTSFFLFEGEQVIAVTEYWADGAEAPAWRNGK